jgi:uncharacterized protein (TIGR00725 family)
MRITLFGVSQPNDYEYNLAYEVGKKIGSKGYTLKNGAYGGTMEASAKGCQEEGGFVIGVGVEGHTIDALGRPNDYNDEVIVTANKNERILEMLDTDMIIVLPGQIGTLEEMFAAWVEAIIKNKKPLIILGEKMNKLIDYLYEANFIRKNQFKYIQKVKNLEELEI